MRQEQTSPWKEKEYVDYLDHERHLFAWCLVAYGGILPTVARSSAEEFYRYQSATEPYRGLVFHDEAWHWAMLKIAGEGYWKARPELEKPSDSYRAESQRYEQSHDTE
jgi:hypothetical protein